MKNIFENLEYPKGETQEKIDDLFSGKSFRVERILSGGQVSSEWYNQEKKSGSVYYKEKQSWNMKMEIFFLYKKEIFFSFPLIRNIK